MYSKVSSHSVCKDIQTLTFALFENLLSVNFLDFYKNNTRSKSKGHELLTVK